MNKNSEASREQVEHELLRARDREFLAQRNLTTAIAHRQRMEVTLALTIEPWVDPLAYVTDWGHRTSVVDNHGDHLTFKPRTRDEAIAEYRKA